MLSTDALPADVLQEFGQAACLCRLPHLDEERQAVHEAIFGSDPEVADATAPTSSLSEVLDDTSAAIASEEGGPVIQRRRSFAHYLSMVSTSPAVVDDPSAFREALWSSPMSAHDGRALVAGHWAALIAKDVWQDALCSVWSHFCRTGLARTRALGRGLTWPETKETVHALTSGLPALQPEATLSEVTGALAAVELGDGLRAHTCTLEALRTWTVRTDTATSGLITLLELDRRAAERHGHGWDLASGVRSAWQLSLAAVRGALQAHVERDATVADALGSGGDVENFG